MPTKEYGFSLIELMVAVIIMGTLVMLAAPSYSTYLNSQSVRNASESLVAGLQIARGEAIRSNATTVFQVVDSLTDACKVNPAGRYWVISHCSAEGACAQNIDKQSAPPTVCSDTAVILAKGTFDANDRVSIDFTNPGKLLHPGLLCYSALGRINATASNCPQDTLDPATTSGGHLAININHNHDACIDDGGKVRCLRVTIGLGGQVRLCEPSNHLSITDPRRC